MNTSEIVAALDKEITRLQQARALISSNLGMDERRGRLAKRDAVVPKKRILSPEARKKIAEAQRKRWAAQKKQG